MGHLDIIYGYFCCCFLILTVWLCGFQAAVSQKTFNLPESHISDNFELSDPPNGLFGPIEISPVAVPTNPYPIEPLSPMYPSFPSTYVPILTGKCPVNFSLISNIINKTAADCSAPLAPLVGNVICCPQVHSLMHILQGTHGSDATRLALYEATADDCFSDVISILASKGSSNTVGELCSVKSSNLTGGSCPVKDIQSFEKIVNTSKLIDACGTIDPLKECCRPVCQPAIMQAAFAISQGENSVIPSSDMPGTATGGDVVNDCKEVVYAWLSRELPSVVANTAFRMLSSCKVNKICPLKFDDPYNVTRQCRDLASPNPACCSSLNNYIAALQRQMIITNRQAINCAAFLGSLLQKGGVMTNIYELCDVDLKDFSLLAYGQQGCLLRSLPADIIFDNATGYSFTCDLSDNIAAPWPSSSSISGMSFCAPEMSLPALPVPQTSENLGIFARRVGILVHLSLCFVYSIFF
ncbi:putative GPI-anchored protein [Apostasia shenzhenica]|uniref:Putative GPI-anchored protein n=1 Tax=Apostasia shenzhenica TaxID=1088818 RepID=A0A2I0AL18_9ASPA|nr:putative GPI-anchored protein [Apostasia shenzhenica]